MKGIRTTILSAALAAALASSASAYVFDEDGHGHPLYWNEASGGLAYVLVRDNVPGGAAGEAAVHAAFASWDAASSNVSFRFDGYVSLGAQAYDGLNVVYWVDSGWAYDPSLAAVTFRYYDTSDGHLLDADMVFNGQSYPWSVGGTGYDIENSAAHEVGHFLGLGHSADAEATMYGRTGAGETKKRTLSADDTAGFLALYGGGSAAPAPAPVASAPKPSAPSTVTSPVTSSSGVSGGGGGGGCSIGNAPRAAGISDLFWGTVLLGVVATRRLGGLRD